MAVVSVVVRFKSVGVVAVSLALPAANACKPKLFLRIVILKEPFSNRVPALKEILPLIPLTFDFFRIILMIPPMPCASYLAPGFVITSMLFIWLAGIDCSTSAILLPKAVDGLPSIKKRMPLLPASSTFPSASIDTCGIFLSTSVATPPCDVISFSAL